MKRMMFGPLLLLAAMVSPEARPIPAALARASTFQPVSGATAQATVSIRIMSGVRFGLDHPGDAPGGVRRSAELTDHDGQAHPAELLEFQ